MVTTTTTRTTRRKRIKHRASTVIGLVFCLLIGAVNVYLMVSISTIESEGSGFGRSNLGSVLAQRQSRVTERVRRTGGGSSEYDRELKSKSSPGWNSPHLLDCFEVARETFQTNETGTTLPVNCPQGLDAMLSSLKKYLAKAAGNSGLKPIPSDKCPYDKPFMMNIHNPLKDDVSKAIFREGCFECDLLSRLLNTLMVYDDAILLDVGGNIGMWSLTAAAAGHTTYTIEPFPENYKRICKSAVMNHPFVERVHVLAMAATDKQSTFRIDVPKRNMGGGRVKEVDFKGTVEDETTVVQGFTIDSLNLPTDRPVVLKLDVEGHELQALSGAMKFLTRANIVYAMTELRPNFVNDGDRTHHAWKKIVRVLTDKGLRPYRVDGKVEMTELNVNNLETWKHRKHPVVRYFDVIWTKEL